MKRPHGTSPMEALRRVLPLEALRRLLKRAEPEPIVPGDRWQLRGSVDGPWPRADGYGVVTILDVRDGWVRYAHRYVFADERLREPLFRHCYRRVQP